MILVCLFVCLQHGDPFDEDCNCGRESFIGVGSAHNYEKLLGNDDGDCDN